MVKIIGFVMTLSQYQELPNTFANKTVLRFRHKDKKLIGFHGFFGKSVLVIDLDTIKQMLIKDFDYFIDKPVFDLSNKYLNSILTQGWI